MTDLLARGAGFSLRRFRASDLDPFLAWRSDPEVAKYQSWEPLSPEAAAAFLAHSATAEIPLAGHWRQIAIADKNDVAIGDMGLFLSDDGSEAEIGITLSQDAQGKGLGRRAVHAAARFLFQNPRLERCLLWTDLENRASLAMIKATGAVWQCDETTKRQGQPDLAETCYALVRDTLKTGSD